MLRCYTAAHHHAQLLHLLSISSELCRLHFYVAAQLKLLHLLLMLLLLHLLLLQLLLQAHTLIHTPLMSGSFAGSASTSSI
jgi:hypothetical protein